MPGFAECFNQLFKKEIVVFVNSRFFGKSAIHVDNYFHFKLLVKLSGMPVISATNYKDHLYSKSNKKRNTTIYFNTNHRTEMKLVSIIMD